ncbi:hypothetical protein Tco_0847477 [Tanacetum coccineum]
MSMYCILLWPPASDDSPFSRTFLGPIIPVSDKLVGEGPFEDSTSELCGDLAGAITGAALPPPEVVKKAVIETLAEMNNKKKVGVLELPVKSYKHEDHSMEIGVSDWPDLQAPTVA